MPTTNPSEVHIPLEAGAGTTALVYPAGAPAVGASLILGHGAGAGQQSTFMVDFARALSNLGLDLITFNFPYTEQGRRIPDCGPVLEACYRSVIETARTKIASAAQCLFIGGKSMGGRIATQVAAADPALTLAGLVLLGYPLHPPGRPAQRRDKHLPEIGRPILFIQGERDAFGTPTELQPIVNSLRPPPTLRVVAGGDHSFKVPRTDPAAQTAVFANIQQDIVNWVRGVVTASTP
jgi:predicted alpha/beta-hydrolase family hydrolase